jgi:ATP-dependent helicase HrpB
LLFLHSHDASFPDVSDEALAASILDWLPERVIGMRRREDLQRLDVGDVLLSMLSWQQRRALDELAPTHFTVPSGSRLPIDYSDPRSPVLAVSCRKCSGSRTRRGLRAAGCRSRYICSHRLIGPYR